MRNFLKLTAMSLQSQMYYRTSFFLNLLSPMVLLAGQYLLWHALYQQQPDHIISGMDAAQMYSYLLIAFTLNHIMGWSSENALSKEIKNGTVVKRCIRPVSFSLSVRCGNDRYPAAPACAQSDHSIRGIPFIRPFSARALFAEYRFIPALHGGRPPAAHPPHRAVQPAVLLYHRISGHQLDPQRHI